MAEQTKVDFSGIVKGLEKMGPAFQESLARRMGVAAGSVIRDEAKERAPVGKTGTWGSITPGLLKSSIYLAYSPEQSRNGQFVYSVSWNNRKAPHGHLIEYGHWMVHPVFVGDDGEVYTDKSKRLKNPKFIPAEPFMRPAWEGGKLQALNASLKEGKKAFTDLMSGSGASE